MRLCAITLNYFGADDTIACVRQLCSQAVDRVCVVDNSADPGQAARLFEAFAGDAGVRVLETGKNTGFAAGVNYGIRRLQPDCDAVLVLNNDTIVPDGCIEALTRGARASGLQIAGPRIQCYPAAARLWSRGSWYHPWCGLDTHRPLPGSMFYITGCCMLIQRPVFSAIGLFDERFFMYGEDVEFCVRASRAGLAAGVIDEAVLYHKTSASALNNSLFYEQQVARAHLLLCRCLFEPRAVRLLSGCTKLPFLAVRAIVRSLRFGNANAVTGLINALMRRSAETPPGVTA